MASIHSMIDRVDTRVGLNALSRTTSGGISSGPTYATAGLDLTQYHGSIEAILNVGVYATGATIQFQDSADNVTFADVTNVSKIVQVDASNARTVKGTAVSANIGATGTLRLQIRTRDVVRRYLRVLLTVGGTCVCSVVTVGWTTRQASGDYS